MQYLLREYKLLHLTNYLHAIMIVWILRLAGKKFGHPAGMKEIKLEKVKRNVNQKLRKIQPEKWGIEK